MNELALAQNWAEEGNYDDAYRLANIKLRENPSDFPWLMVMTYLMLCTEKPLFAYHLAKRCTELDGKNAGAWMNLGQACRDLQLHKEAQRYCKRGLQRSKSPEQKSMLCVNMASSLIDEGKWAEGEKYCRQALELKPDSVKGASNLGFCQLAQGQWAEGWKNYRKVIGHEWRPFFDYGVPLWDGESKGTIVVHGEQGLGDQICFASMLPDLQRWAEENDSRVVVDIDPRLVGVLRRSFPGITVHGTLGNGTVKWPASDKPDYAIPIGQLGEYFRNSDEDFPRKPFLIPDPDREYMWRSLFEAKGKPVIGIAWSGGVVKTGKNLRTLTLAELSPLFEAIDAHWVSLQYKPAKVEGTDVVEYPHATLTQDYDDTLAMVAALDAVVGVPTTVIHAAGALGVRNIAMCAPMKCWKYNSGLPFHPTTAVIDNTEGWGKTIEETASHLRDLCTEYSSDSTPANLLPITSRSTQSTETPASLSA